MSNNKNCRECAYFMEDKEEEYLICQCPEKPKEARGRMRDISACNFYTKKVDIDMEKPEKPEIKEKEGLEEEHKILLKGIDSLYVGFVMDIEQEVLEVLNEYKSKARSEEEGPVKIGKALNIGKLGENHFSIMPNGVQMYKYIIFNDLATININQRVENDAYPNVRVQFKASLLWGEGWEKAYNQIMEVLSLLGEVREEIVSRVDLCSDILGIDYLFKDYDSFTEKIVSRAKKVDCVSTNRTINAWSIGARTSKIYCRIYNKTLEIKEKGKKEWFYELWNKANDLDQDLMPGDNREVWRVEFELSRKFLKQFQIKDFEDLKSTAGDMWRYLAEDWLSLRYNDNKNTSRRTVLDFWQSCQELKNFFGGVNGVARTRTRTNKIDKFIRGIVGNMSSISAILGNLDLERALWFIHKYIKNEIGNKEFENDVWEKIPRYESLRVAC